MPQTEKAQAKVPVFPDVVSIAPAGMNIPDAEPTALYHVGTRRGSPLQNATIGGISFPLFTKGALIGENKVQGARVRLTPSQIAKIQLGLATKVVRWSSVPGSGERRGTVLSANGIGYQPEVGDEPLAKHLYCLKVPDEQVAEEAQEPASMLVGV